MFKEYLLYIFVFCFSQRYADAVYQGKNLFLIDAVQENNIGVVKWLIKDEAFLDVQDDAGKTPLMRAASNVGGLALVRILLDAGARIDIKNNLGYTAIHEAILSGSIETLQLLYNNVSKEALNDVVEGSPLLHIAAQRGDDEIVNFLSGEGESPLAKDKNGQTAVHLAAMAGQVNLLSLWSDQIIGYNFSEPSPLMLAILSGQEKSAQVLIEHGINVDTRDATNSTPLHAAAFLGDMKLIELLIDNNATIDLQDSLGRTPLFIAMENGHYECSKYLIESNCSLNSTDEYGNTLLHAAAASGNRNILDLLVFNKETVDTLNNNGTTPLIVAAKKGDNEVMEHLIDLGADINTMDQNKDCLVSIASSKGNLKILKEINEKKKVLKYDVKNFENATPLHLSVRHDNVELVNFVIESTANEYYYKKNNLGSRFTRSARLQISSCPSCYKEVINLKDGNGKTPIYYAAEAGNLDAIRSLVLYGGNASTPDAVGRLPLHAAAFQGRDKAVINFLTLLTQNINTGDNTGKTPLFLAAEAGHLETLEHLIDIGADINKTEDATGWTIMHTAVVNGRLNVVSKLLDYKELVNKPDSRGRTPVWYALANNKLDILPLLRKADAVLEPAMDIFEAINEGKWTLAKNLFNDCQGPASTNRNGETLMHIAAAAGHTPIIKELSQYRCLITKTDFNGHTPAMQALANKHWDSLSLLQSLEFVDLKKYLTASVKSQNLEAVKYLIEQGADVNSKDEEGSSLLRNAVLTGSSSMVEGLIDLGADHHGSSGMELLKLAVDKSYCEVVNTILQKDPNKYSQLWSYHNKIRSKCGNLSYHKRYYK